VPTLNQEVQAGGLTATTTAAADHEGLDPQWLRGEVAAARWARGIADAAERTMCGVFCAIKKLEEAGPAG
jgi:hypothetical protein